MTDTQKQDRIGEMMREYREESRRQAHAASKVRESERDQQAALIASQARRIEELEAVYDAARGLCYGEDWNNGTHAKSRGYRQKLVAAVNAIEPLFATAIRARGGGTQCKKARPRVSGAGPVGHVGGRL